MPYSDEILYRQLDDILDKIKGRYGIQWSLNRVLRHVNKAILGEYRTDFCDFTTFNKLHVAVDGYNGFGREMRAFTNYTEQFLGRVQNKFLKEELDIIFTPSPPLPDLTKHSREQLYRDIVDTYFDLKNKLNFGYGLLNIFKENGIHPPTRNEFVLLWQKIWGFISDTLYKGQIMVRSLFEPYVVHTLLWLGLELVLAVYPSLIYEQFDEFAGKGKVIPGVTITWDGKKDQEALPMFLRMIVDLYEHRVPVDPKWLPNFNRRAGFKLDSEASLVSWLIGAYFGNSIHMGTYKGEVGYQLSGVRNIYEAWMIKAPNREYAEEVDYQRRLKIYQDTLYGEWLIDIKALSDRFYNLMVQALPVLKQPCVSGDLIEQVSYLEDIKNIYLGMANKNEAHLQSNSKLDESQRVPRGPARNIPPSPFGDFDSKEAESIPNSSRRFITAYIERTNKGLVGFQTPLSNTHISSNDTLGAQYHELKKTFQHTYNALEKQVKANAATNSFAPTKVDASSISQLFTKARQFAKDQKIKEAYSRYNLKQKLDE